MDLDQMQVNLVLTKV